MFDFSAKFKSLKAAVASAVVAAVAAWFAKEYNSAAAQWPEVVNAVAIFAAVAWNNFKNK